MTADDIRLLYEYDRWANRRVLKAAAALSSQDFARDLGGRFGSVRDTLVHIIGGEWIWLTYWADPSPDPAREAELTKRRDALFNPNRFPDIGAVQSRWAEVEKEQIRFVNLITDDRLEQLLPLNSKQVSLAHLMQHMANHSTYHRGQIAWMMRQLGGQPVATDFHVFLLDRLAAETPH